MDHSSYDSELLSIGLGGKKWEMGIIQNFGCISVDISGYYHRLIL